MAAHAEAEAAKVRSGLIEPGASRQAAEGRRPLVDHIDDWQSDLTGRGNTARHANLSADRARRVVSVVKAGDPAIVAPRRRLGKCEVEEASRTVRLLGAARLADLTPSAVRSVLATMRAAGAALETLSHYLRATKCLTRWMLRDGRSRDDALSDVKGYNAETDRRHERRALTAAELGRLVEAAARGEAAEGMSDPDRAACI
jgi:hypothetical protein